MTTLSNDTIDALHLADMAKCSDPDLLLVYSARLIAREREIRCVNRKLYGIFRWKYQWDRLLAWAHVKAKRMAG